MAEPAVQVAAGPPVAVADGVAGGSELALRLYIPVTEGRAHRGAVGSLAEAQELAKCREGGGHVADWRVIAVDVELPVGVLAAGDRQAGGGAC